MFKKTKQNKKEKEQIIITMKKTYVTKMPNHIGAFLKASKCFSELGINITRVSYNKAVDSHTLFIEVDGEQAQFEKAKGYYKTAIECLLEMPENDKDEIILGSAYTNLTSCFTMLHQYPEAEDA